MSEPADTPVDAPATPASGVGTPLTPEAVLARPSVRAFLSALAATKLPNTVRVLPGAASTAATAAAQLGCSVGAIANSLLFEAAGAPLLVLTSGGHRVDTKALGPRLGLSKSAIKRAKPDFVKTHTGYSIGGVAPLGHPERLRTIIDPTLKEFSVVWAAAGHHQAVFSLTYQELVDVTGAEVVQVD